MMNFKLFASRSNLVGKKPTPQFNTPRRFTTQQQKGSEGFMYEGTEAGMLKDRDPPTFVAKDKRKREGDNSNNKENNKNQMDEEDQIGGKHRAPEYEGRGYE